jgi:hypothetical protein
MNPGQDDQAYYPKVVAGVELVTGCSGDLPEAGRYSPYVELAVRAWLRVHI